MSLFPLVFPRCEALGPAGVVCLLVPLVSDIGSTAGRQRSFSPYGAVCLTGTFCPRSTRPSVRPTPPPPPTLACCFLSMFSGCRRLFWWTSSDPLHLADGAVTAAAAAAALSHTVSRSLAHSPALITAGGGGSNNTAASSCSRQTSASRWKLLELSASRPSSSRSPVQKRLALKSEPGQRCNLIT